MVVQAGKETLTSADRAQPGDVIEYRVDYHNTSKNGVGNVVATLPMPANGVEYILGTDAPRGATASIDGKTFSAIPLMRTVKLPNGQTTMQAVPSPNTDICAGLSETCQRMRTSASARACASSLDEWLDMTRASIIILATIVAALMLPRAAMAAAPAGTTIGNQASATYMDAGSVSRTVTSNAVVTAVQQVASLTLTANNTKTGAIGGQMYFPHTLTNTGNGPDTFTLSPGQSGTVTLTGVAFYADANGDGIPDSSTAITTTGQIASGRVFKLVASGTIPGSAVAGNTNTLTVTATSVFTPATTAANTDSTTVTGNAVIQVSQAIDLTQGPSSGTRTITLNYTNVGNVAAANLTLADLVPSGMTYVANSARWSVTGAGTALTDASNSDSQSGIIYDWNVTTTDKITAVIASVAPGSSGTLTFQASINSKACRRAQTRPPR